MTRQFTADDYEAIRKGMEGLRPSKPQSDFEKALESGAAATASDSQALAIVKLMAIMPRRMTADECAIVAQAFDCKSACANPRRPSPGCGKKRELELR